MVYNTDVDPVMNQEVFYALLPFRGGLPEAFLVTGSTQAVPFGY